MSKKLIYLTSFVLVLALAGTNVVFGGIVIERQVNKSSDDYEQYDPGGMRDVSSTDLEMPYEDPGKIDKQIIGIRWEDIAIPKGSTILNAWVRFDVDEIKDGDMAVSLLIEGELSPDTVTFSSSVDIANRPRTAAKVVWVPDNWTTTHVKHFTSNIASVIEEIVSQDGWESGNSLVLIISDDPSNPSQGIRCAESFDGAGSNTDRIPLLHIEFTTKYSMQPNPADGAIHSFTFATLGWTAGETAVSHNVYLGENFDDVNDGTGGTLQGNPSEAVLLVGLPGMPYPGGLVANTTYYWRVDEVEADGTTIHKGDVWSFTIPPSNAYAPHPPDRARFVDRNVTLSWTAGLNAMVHYVYFGDNFDDVNNGTVGAPLTTTNYTPTPSPLAEKTLYYWRVDEFDAFTTHKGEVWSFKTSFIADPNLIGWWRLDESSGTTTIDWSGYGNHGTLHDNPQWTDGIMDGALEFNGSNYVTIDGVADNITNNDITLSGWVKTTDSHGLWLSCNTSGRGNVALWSIDNSLAAMYDGADSGYEGYSNTMVSDGEWHMLTYVRSGPTGYIYVDGIQENTHSADYSFSASDLWSIAQEWDGGGPSDFLVGIVDDVRIYDTALTQDEVKLVMRGDLTRAWNPSPANDSLTDIERATPLSWLPGEKASQHDVYFGTDRDAVNNADTSDTTGVYRDQQIGTSYIPLEGVEWDSGPYYWRIDEDNTDGTVTKGGIWSFTVADYLFVDDFEDYNDWEPDEIWRTWVDGYGISTNGSTVGLPAPNWGAGEHYAETTLVHGGDQSMPLFYDNAGAAAYSEGERTFAVPQDWTTAGVQTLSLHFRGTAGNTGQLYVEVNGSKVVYDGNAGDVQRAGWQAWNIELASFGTNMQSVTTMGIGIDGNGASGTLYFDDIRLYAYSPQFITPVEPSSAGLIGHWKFDGNTLDSSGLGNHGTANGGPTYAAGQVGQAMSFDGINDYVVIDSVTDDITNDDITLAGWVKTDDTSSVYWFSCNGPTGANVNVALFGILGGQVAMYDINTAEGHSKTLVNDLDWHHLAYSRSGSTGSIYVDGNLENTHTADFTFTDPLNRWSIGQEWDDLSAGNFLAGMVDDARIYDYALSLEEVAWLTGRTEPFDKPF